MYTEKRRPKMANTCGECLLFEGSSRKCGSGTATTSSNTIAKGCSSFKAPASTFDVKRCGGCRLFEGIGEKCGKGTATTSSNTIAKGCSSYAPIPG